MNLTIPGRYYRMYPPGEYLGHAEENLELPLGETAFMLIDVYGLGYSPGEPEPEMARALLQRVHRGGAPGDGRPCQAGTGGCP